MTTATEQQELMVGIYDTNTGELKRCIGVSDPRVAFCDQWNKNRGGMQARHITSETAEVFDSE